MESYVNKIKLPNSKRWISGNKSIDEFIQSTHQKDRKPILWVPYKNFSDINRIGDGGFSTVFSAHWKNHTTNELVALKLLHNSQNLSERFLNEWFTRYNNAIYLFNPVERLEFMQFWEADKIIRTISTTSTSSLITHDKAVYTSRFLSYVSRQEHENIFERMSKVDRSDNELLN
ncbi:3458_t:CDS:2, partial [Cetraspora pellucida]